MHHAVKAFQIRLGQRAQILAYVWDLFGRPELAACEQVGIQAHNVMSGSAQNGASNCADVAFMSS